MARKKVDSTVDSTPEPTVGTFYKVSVTITEDVLGTCPSDPTIYSKYVAAKAFEAEKKLAKTEEEKKDIAQREEALVREELAALPQADETNKGVTVFRRNEVGLFLSDTMVRGHLKEAAQAIGIDGSAWGAAGKIDRHLFVTDANQRPVRAITIYRGGLPVTKADDIYERPLRAMTMQGPRVTLAASERVKAPCSISFYLYVVGLGSTRAKLTPDVIRDLLNYGQYTGYGQYRSGGHGRFDCVVEVLE